MSYETTVWEIYKGSIMEKIIVADCDGVLLNWEYAFDCWMNERGFFKGPKADLEYNIGGRYGLTKEQGKKLVAEFNQSAAIGFLPALRDATWYVKRLHEEHGYVFDVVTSLSTDKHAAMLRERNLKKVFGENTFRKIKCLPTGANKKGYLKKYYENSGYFWIEDKVENADDGLAVGMKSLLVEHGFNMYEENLSYPIVKNWKDIYDHIVDPLFKTYGPYGTYSEYNEKGVNK